MTIDDIKQFRGSYVRMTYWVRSDASDATREMTSKGILGFSRARGIPKLDGHQIAYDHQTHGVTSCDVEFRPAADALKLLCMECARNHPLGKALRELRIPMESTYGKGKQCSACGSPRGLSNIPSCFWKFNRSTDHGKVKDEMFQPVFSVKLRDANAEIYLYLCDRLLKGGAWGYRSMWKTKEGAVYHAEHAQPPLASMWTRYFDMSDLRQFADRVTCGGRTLYEKTA